MPAISAHSRRTASTKKDGVHCEAPCMRCINRYAVDGLVDGVATCTFDPNDRNWIDFKYEGVQTKRCHYCLSIGQDCLAPPREVHDELKKLESNIKEARDETKTDEERKLAKECVLDYAQSIVATVNAAFRPQAKHLTAHSGKCKLTEEYQSGVMLKFRDRSLAGMKRKKERKDREDAYDSEDDVPSTPKRKAHGFRAKVGTDLEKKTAAEKGTPSKPKKKKKPAPKSKKARKKVVVVSSGSEEDTPDEDDDEDV